MDGTLAPPPTPRTAVLPDTDPCRVGEHTRPPRYRKWRVGPFLILEDEARSPGPGRTGAGGDGQPAPRYAAELAHEEAGASADGVGRAVGRAFVTIATGEASPAAGSRPAGELLTVIVTGTADPGLDAAIAEHGPGPIAGPRATMLGTVLLSLTDALPLATGEDMPFIDAAMNAVLLMALRRASAPGEAGARSTAQLRSRVEEVIARNIASARLDVMRIAELSGVSRTTLYRLFEADGGVARYVQRLRLDLVRKDLCDPAEMATPIARLAQRRGLYCTASFNRSFRRVYGMTPGEVRESGLGPCPARSAGMKGGSRATA